MNRKWEPRAGYLIGEFKIDLGAYVPELTDAHAFFESLKTKLRARPQVASSDVNPHYVTSTRMMIVKFVRPGLSPTQLRRFCEEVDTDIHEAFTETN